MSIINKKYTKSIGDRSYVPGLRPEMKGGITVSFALIRTN
jgi:hypothetical protein